MRSLPKISFEIFPPKTPKGNANLDATLEQLAPLRPEYVSVTYGAAGSGQERTVRLVERLMEGGLPLAAHLTCVGAMREDVDRLAGIWRDMGIKRIVALRGDVPGGGPWVPHKDGYTCAANLVNGLRRIGAFDIAVACYPECHPDSPSQEADIENLKAKQDAGATTAITQYCFETETILRFRDRAAAAGVVMDIVPGVLPIVDFNKTVEFSRKCGASVPDWLGRQFEGHEDDAETSAMVGVSVAVDQCRVLLREGFRQFHLYTMNKAPLSYAVCRRLGVHPAISEAA